MMNQLKGNVRSDSAKRAKFEKIQENLVLNGWKKQTVGWMLHRVVFVQRNHSERNQNQQSDKVSNSRGQCFHGGRTR
jgi:hypothetical protein